jgi:hypothetical protein
MRSLLKSTVLGVGLLVSVAAAAQAQSVSSLPPTSAEPTAVTTTPPVSSAKIYPNPGNNGSWKEDHYQAVQTDESPARHPYTASPHFGPAPN